MKCAIFIFVFSCLLICTGYGLGVSQFSSPKPGTKEWLLDIITNLEAPDQEISERALRAFRSDGGTATNLIFAEIRDTKSPNRIEFLKLLPNNGVSFEIF